MGMQQGFYFCTRGLVGFEWDIIVTAGAYGYYRVQRRVSDGHRSSSGGE